MSNIAFRVILSITIVLVIMLTVFATVMTEPVFAKGIKPPKTAAPITATLITDAQGLGDYAFNDAAVVGLLLAEKKIKADTSILVSHTADDYSTNFGEAITAAPDLIISSGFTMAGATASAAYENPDQRFAIIDSIVGGSNVASLVFKEHEGAFLVGVIAGLTTDTNIIGCVIGGYWVDKFVVGFRAGIQSVNPDATLIVEGIDSFTDPPLGYEAATRLFNQGADVVYHVSGLSGLGVIDAAADRGLWAIGCDVDQSNVNPDAVLCSMVKKVDIATYLTIKSVADGTFNGGTIEFGVAEKGVGYSDNAGNVTKEVVEIVKKYERAISNGTIVVPYNNETYNDFFK